MFFFFLSRFIVQTHLPNPVSNMGMERLQQLWHFFFIVELVWAKYAEGNVLPCCSMSTSHSFCFCVAKYQLLTLPSCFFANACLFVINYKSITLTWTTGAAPSQNARQQSGRVLVCSSSNEPLQSLFVTERVHLLTECDCWFYSWTNKPNQEGKNTGVPFYRTKQGRWDNAHIWGQPTDILTVTLVLRL